MADAQESPQRWEAGPLGTATNNVAELTALLRLLESTDPAAELEVRMDSQYAMNAVTKWLPGWKRNGWKTAAGKPVANRELVVGIDTLLSGRTVEFRYVPAHQVDGDPLNAVADQGASEAAVAQQAAGTAHGSPMLVPDLTAQSQRPRAKPAKRTSAGKAASGRPARSVKAKFPGRCHCGRSYAAGETIAKNPAGWGHEACRAAEPVRAT